MENWKPALGFEEFYEVSSEGRARRVARGPHTRPGRLMKPCPSRSGYVRFAFCVGNKVTMRIAHRAVWEAFNGPIPPGLQINHKNGVKDDNRLCNLEVVTQSENARHSYRVLGQKPNINPNKGEKNGRAKLRDEDIPVILQLRAAGLSQQAIADRLNVAQTTVSRVLLQRSWAHIQPVCG